MTMIDRISFDFNMADEMFARSLYANWDEFCQHCVTDILEDFFAAYDNMETFLEIPSLKLDLGNISEEDFFEVFPIRLREELEKNFLLFKESGRTNSTEPDDAGHAREKRIGNLLHYLKHGFCLPEWERPDFDLYEELRKCLETGFGSRLLRALEQPDARTRLFRQLDSNRLEKLFLHAVDGPGTDSLLSMLLSPSFSLSRYERQRLLSVILETVPQSVVEFIHNAHNTGRLNFVAELLEHPHVRSIMAAETENHAEIGVPEYWYRLYTWLLEYYPFNGVPMFGDKSHFGLHLNRSLLNFIHKRNDPTYLSKVDLTLKFLLEVFGAEYYLTVLNIIYHNQRLNEDGSPESGDSYVWELYYILLQLSLIGKEQTKATHAGEQPKEEKAEKTATSAGIYDTQNRYQGAFGIWLEQTELPDSMKRSMLALLIQDKPELLIQWLADKPDRKHLLLLAEIIAVLTETVEKATTSVMWLRNIGKDQVKKALKMALWQGISTGAYPISDSASTQMRRISELFYKEITGRELPSDDKIYAEIMRAASTSEAEAVELAGIPENYFRRNDRADEKIASLKTVLSDNSISEQTRKLFVLQWFDAYRGRENELITVLISEKLLDTVIALLDKTALHNIIMRLAEQADTTDKPDAGKDARRFVGWLVRLLFAIAGNDRNRIKTVAEVLISRLPDIPDTTTAVGGSSHDDSGTTKILPDMDDTRTAFEQCLNDSTGMTGWLQDRKYTSERKKEVLFHYLNDAPKEAIRLLQTTVGRDESMIELWAEIIGKEAMLYLLGQSGIMLQDRLNQTIGMIDSVLAENGNALFAGSSEEWEQTIAKAMLRLTTETSTTETESGNMAGQKTAAWRFEVPATGQEEKRFDKWVAWLLTPSVSDTEKSQILRHYARWQPELLWKFVRYSTTAGSGKISITPGQWSTWMGTEDWLEMISGVSLSLGNILYRTTETVFEKYGTDRKLLAEGLARFVIVYPIDRMRHENASDIVKKYLKEVIARSWENNMPDGFLERLPGLNHTERTDQEKTTEQKIQTKKEIQEEQEPEGKQRIRKKQGTGEEQEILKEPSQPEEKKSVLETVIQVVEDELHITDSERTLEEAVQPEYIEVPNAGLCLLAIWFTRLFGMLGLLKEKEDGKKDLRDMEARIRAIFILQRIVTDEPREYKEQELAFNRILTGCPFYVPLPKRLPLTSQEIQTVESMLSGVKSNWDKLKNTSVKGFQHSFIERPGKLEQREDKWVLYVENRSYDLLLDSLPWSYRQIRLPWLKKNIHVVWRDKEEIGFDVL